MKVIAARVWREPAVFIGLLTTVGLVVITLATGDKWDAATIAGVIAPLAAALGIRQLVTPDVGAGEESPPR
jgi:ascorbate-specific PTS system EIIC-type component UlaA